ncbi:MAG: ABC-F family ATP-binding cassette domain-containing protein [Eubacteriales bacterium]|nr:ABC-F family ATP-binding cassette domain-containing protein [Eubacteriales bacterium]
MNLLSIEHLTKSYTERMLFADAEFYLQEGEKVGIIGINGAGKSTLLKIMAGQEEPDDGTVVTANHAVIAYLPQHPVFAAELSALECVLAGHDAGQEDMTDLETRAKTMMTKLGITNFEQKAEELSGGQRKRLALVSVLLKEADILILDEPTNHLDNEMADWLEEQLKGMRKALVMVTHDRYFLDSVCGRIAEVDQGKIYSYQANYSGFLELKAQRADMLLAKERKRQSILRTELAWVQRGARARSTKQKARLERYEELKNRQAPVADGRVELGSVSSRLGRTTVEVSHLEKAYGDRKLISDFSYIFLKNDRVGFIGQNGCGKTTLMKLLTGQLAPDAGEIIVGQTVKIGYYAQEVTQMDPKQRVIDYIRDVAEYVQTAEGSVSASQMLERFLFEGSAQYSQIGRLSGGEKRRLNLLRVLMGAPNVFILDEPTNDLDIITLTVLEDYLDHFEGIVIIVSHDRYFLDRCVQRIFAFEGDGRLRQYEGGYSDYALRKSMEAEEKEQQSGVNVRVAADDGKGAEKKADWKKPPRRLKFTYMEQKEYETIEGDIAALEEKISGLEAEILEAATDFVKLNRLTEEKEEASALLEEKMDRWMFLEDKAARIAAGEYEQET